MKWITAQYHDRSYRLGLFGLVDVISGSHREFRHLKVETCRLAKYVHVF